MRGELTSQEMNEYVEMCLKPGKSTGLDRCPNELAKSWGCQRATLSVNYKPGDWDSVRAWILKAGSGWHQAETAEDLQICKFAAGSLGAVTTHRIR